MNTLIRGRTRYSSLTVVIVGAVLLFLGVCSGASAQAAESPLRGAHEGMAVGEKTDDLGITVPMASVDFPARRYPASHDFPTGPEVGERLPEFTLPNQDGELIDFHQHRGDSKSIVVFYRSVVW